jgi:hypothetical protein
MSKIRVCGGLYDTYAVVERIFAYNSFSKELLAT